MSHVATISIEVKDLDALAAAAAQLGLELVKDQKTYRWWGRSVGDAPLPEGFTASDLGKCDHAIRIPNDSRAYEIGVCRRRDPSGSISGKGGGYQLLWDFFGGGYGMQDKVGQDAKKLIQEYSAQVAMKDLMRKGYRTTFRRQEDGRILVQATK